MFENIEYNKFHGYIEICIDQKIRCKTKRKKYKVFPRIENKGKKKHTKIGKQIDKIHRNEKYCI